MAIGKKLFVVSIASAAALLIAAGIFLWFKHQRQASYLEQIRQAAYEDAQRKAAQNLKHIVGITTIGCATQNLLESVERARVSGEQKQFNELYKIGCHTFKEGEAVRLLETDTFYRMVFVSREEGNGSFWVQITSL